ncbi:hypothetical protein PoB_000720000 [Plakobranchus ocellatus]|uniref:Uncharacterized protein n=1 Tax=Plakobranchus ocellatus TaxID=259542 RepID=A0AAV3YDU2_9GAST|nr:hypothetical protein PoB_000720000 [Plakobranchus ocellatus]
MLWTIFIVATLCSVVTSFRQPDPRCMNRNCPPGSSCRVLSRCPNPMSCTLEAYCIREAKQRSQSKERMKKT